MADPMTMMAGASMAASAGGGILSAFGGMEASRGKASMYRYQAGVAQINERLAREDADYTRHVGEVEAQRAGMKQRFTEGTTKATQAARGIAIDRGSPTEVRESMRDVGLFDQALIRSSAARKAYGREIDATKAKLEAGMYREAADRTEDAGMMSMLGSLIGTAGSVSSKWLQWGSVGPSGRPAYAEDNRYGE